MFSVDELKNDIIIPALEDMGTEFNSESAINLLLGTCAQESHMGQYREQLGGGPALGIYQCEPETYGWLCEKYQKLLNALYPHGIPPFITIETDDRLATIICRLRYWAIAMPLPDANDIESLAHYWKDFYNTPKGKGLTSEFISNYHRFVEKGNV